MTKADHLKSRVEHLYRKFDTMIRTLILVLHLLRNLQSSSFEISADDSSDPGDTTFGA